MNKKNPVEIYYQIHRKIMDPILAFNEIMSGKNPLTKEEVQALFQKHPEWTFLENWINKE